MLTRLKVSGFKNLVDVDIRLGPFTCVAGANGTGKSNLFDAIGFLSRLARGDTLNEAASAVRNEKSKNADVRHIFHRVGNEYAEEMSFEAEMIIPEDAIDDLGQEAEASTTFVKYILKIGYRIDESQPSFSGLKIIEESLDRIPLSEASKRIYFNHSVKQWRQKVIKGRRTKPFISTKNDRINLHQEGRQGLPKEYKAAGLTRTILSTVNALERPTALIAQREMQSWRLLQLEPSAMREPDKFTTTPGIGTDGSHIAASLNHLARSSNKIIHDRPSNSESWVYEQAAGRLYELLDDVLELRVDRDEKRELLTLLAKDKSGTEHPARSLSDGTLRFLALAVLELDPKPGGVICLEEPENGIHPLRIPAMINLLQDLAVDAEYPAGLDNPLRQVIINTHSPSVVSQVPDYCLLVAELKEAIKNGQRFKKACFSWLPNTWRVKADPQTYTVAKGKLLAYLCPLPIEPAQPHKRPRVADREDLNPWLPYMQE